MSNIPPLIWFSDFDLESEHHGAHSKHLAKLTQAKFPLVPGFLITSSAYFDFLKDNMLDHKIKQLLSTLSFERPESLMQGENHIKKIFEEAKLADTLQNELKYYYHKLGHTAVTLSLYATGPHGMKHVTLHAEDTDAFINQVKKAWAEMFTGNALWKRHHNHKLDHLKTGAEIVVQKVLKGDKTGIAITIEPINHEKDKIVILTSSPHEADFYLLSKKNLVILDRKLKHQTKTEKLSHEEILEVAKLAKKIEEYLYFPQEITWAIESGKIVIMDIKPVSTLPKHHTEKKRRLALARGKGTTTMIGSGFVYVIKSPADLQKSKPDDVVIVPLLKVSQVHHLKKVRGIVIEANPGKDITVLLQKRGIPAIGNVKNATKHFQNGHLITIHGGKGEIYQGGFL